MQIGTTTITTETTQTGGTNFQITALEKAINAFCDCCDNQASGTKELLSNAGWGFGNGSEFCPECNF